ncbi:MAG: 50S ribosomal protein L21 [Vampirovibrionales bacterium]|nr:50S ribosomal protein L21 [Vampirovibrionales bacterium]
MYAVVSINGKQFKLEAGKYTDIDLLADKAENDALTFDQVLFAADDAGKVLIGQPAIAGASVNVTVVRHWRGPKTLVFKYRCKKGTRKKNGHRQSYTRIQVDAIKLPA